MEGAPERRRRLDGYVRVSQVGKRGGESFISPQDLQEDRIRAWAEANGHEIIQVFPELDVSGGKMDRPKLNEVMRGSAPARATASSSTSSTASGARSSTR